MTYQHLLFIIIFVIFLIGIPLIAYGQFVEIRNPLQYGTIPEVIAAITQSLKTIAISLGSIMLIISGIQYLTSAGNEERATKAKKTMFYTVIGVAIVIAVAFIVDIIKGALGG